VVTRRSLPPRQAGIERVQADLEHEPAAIDVCRDASVVYGCVGLPYPAWTAGWPPLMRGMLAGAEAAGARFVFLDNLYMYGPQTEPLHEGLPLTDYGRKPKLRAEITQLWQQAHAQGRVRVAALRASDFYGPRTKVSMLGELVAGRAAAGKPAMLIGDIDQPHTFAYVPDLARNLDTLAHAEDDDFGQAWHAPSAPPITVREATEILFRAAGHPPRLSIMPEMVRRLLGTFNGTLRELGEMRHLWDRPYLVDHGKWDRRFGSDPTPFAEGAEATIAWWRAELSRN